MTRKKKTIKKKRQKLEQTLRTSEPFDVARTQARFFTVFAAFAFLLSAAAFHDGRIIQEESEPRRTLSSLDAERTESSKALANAVAALASRLEIVETSAKTDVSYSNRTTNREPLRFLVDLNTAKKSELMILPRIGDELADRILEYREENGGFESIDELTKIKGIGAKTLEKLRPFCAVSTSDETP